MAHKKGIYFNSISLSQVYIHPNYLNYHEAYKCLEEGYDNVSSREMKLLGENQKQIAYLKSKVNPTSGEKSFEEYYREAIKHNKNDFETYIEYANTCMDSKKSKALELLVDCEKVLNDLNKPIKPEFFNNIAILYLENRDYKRSKEYFQRCM